ALLATGSSSTTRTEIRNGYFEAASVRPGAGELDVAAELAREALADGKTHSESLGPVALMVVHLVELVEQIRNVFARDPPTRVGHGDAPPPGAHRHRQRQPHTAVVRVLDRVVHEVGEDPLELVTIGDEARFGLFVRGDGDAQVKALLFSQHLEARSDLR